MVVAYMPDPTHTRGAPKKRKRRRKILPVAEIPVIEVLSPQINVYGHRPKLSQLEDGSFLGGCSCGWKSRNRSWQENGMGSWWKHARLVGEGYLLMNGESE